MFMEYRICHSSSVRGGVMRVHTTRIDGLYTFLSTQSEVNTTPTGYQSLSKRDRQKVKKSLPYVIPGELHKYKLSRKMENIKSVNLLAIDIDSPEYTRRIDYSMLDEYNHIRYHTISSLPDSPRLRILFPVKPDTYTADQYKNLVLIALDALLPDIRIDECSYRVNQPMFLPIYFKGDQDNDHFRPVVVRLKENIDTLLTGNLTCSAPLEVQTQTVSQLDNFVKQTNRQPEGMTIQNVASLLLGIDSASRDTWLKVSLALRHEAGDDIDRQVAFRQLFVDWSAGKLSGITPDSYSGEEDCKRHWNSISAQPSGCQTPTTIGTIKHLARQTVCLEAVNGNVSPQSISYEWVYVEATKSFYNLVNGVMTPKASFDLVNTKYFKVQDNLTKSGNLRLKPSDYLASGGLLQEVMYLDYAPEQEKLFTLKGINYANLYTAPIPPLDSLPAERASGAPTALVNHLQMTWPEDYTIILEWIAYLIQNPAGRVIWCPILQGEPGCGKTAVTVVLQNLLGTSHVKTTNSSEVSSNFNSWAYNRRVTIIEELKLYGKGWHNTAEKLKEYITNRTVSVNEKYAPERNVANTVSYIAYTNHKSPLPVERGDRRYAILSSPVTSNQVKLKSELGKFDRLFTTLRGSGGSLHRYFISYPIPASFNPESRAPATRGSVVARQLSKSQLELYVDAVVTSTFEGCNLISAHLVHLAINKAFREVYRPNKNDLMRVTEYLVTEYAFSLTGKQFTFFATRMEILAKPPYGDLDAGMKKTVDKFNRFDNMEVLSQFKKEQL